MRDFPPRFVIVFVIYADDVRIVARVARALPRDTQAVPAENWAEVARSAPSATCLIIAVPKPQDSRLPTELERLADRVSCPPVVAIVERGLESARAFHRIRLAGLLWLDEIDQKLGSAVNAVRRRPLVDLITERALPNAELPVALRSALHRALTDVPPPATVKQLAFACGYHRSTLERQWRHVSPCRRLDEFLGCLTIAHAVSDTCSGYRTDAIAERLGIHPRTLQRLTVRLSGLKLRILAARPPGEIAARLVGRAAPRHPIPTDCARMKDARCPDSGHEVVAESLALPRASATETSETGVTEERLVVQAAG